MENLYVSYISYESYKYQIQVHCVREGKLELIETHIMRQTDDMSSDEERIINLVRKLHPESRIQWYGMFPEDIHNKIVDKSMERGAYIEHCVNEFWHVLYHIIKICIWSDSQEVPHWHDEIYGTLNRLMRYTLKKDGGDNHVRNKAFTENFVYGYFDDDFSGYDKIRDEFIYVIKKENKRPEDYDIYFLVDSSRESIQSFLEGLKEVFEKNDSEFLRNYVDSFC